MDSRTPTGQPVHSVEPRQWAKLRNTADASETLVPGSFATAFLMRFDATSGDYLEADTPAASHKGEFQIHDPFKLNFLLPGEVVPVRMSSASNRYEIDGSHGLRRAAVVDKVSGSGSGGSANIIAGSSGRVLLYTKGAVTSPAQYVTAWLNWLHGDVDAEDGTRLIIQYYRGEDKWIIEGADCEPTV